MGKMVRWFFIVLGCLILLLLGGLTAVSILGVAVNMDTARPLVAEAVSTALGRKVVVAGPLELFVSSKPWFEVQGLRIENPQGWENREFVEVKLLRVQLNIPDLLEKKITVEELTAEGVSLYLESRSENTNNWSFSSVPSAQPDTKAKKVPVPVRVTGETEASAGLVFGGLNKLYLKEITVHYRDTVLNKNSVLSLDEWSGEAAAGESVLLRGTGDFQGKSFDFELEAGPLNGLRSQEKPWPLTIAGTIAETPFSAKGNLGSSDSQRALTLQIGVGAVDIGACLSWLNIVHDLTASTQDLTLDAQLRGQSLHEILQRSALRIELKGGVLDLRNPQKESGFLLNELNGNIEVQPGQPLTMSMSAKLDATPVEISLQGMPIVELVRNPDSFPWEISLAAAGAELDFSGRVNLPVDSKTFNLAMHLKGAQLDSLNELFKIDLPPFGPYSVDAAFTATESGYELSSMTIQVGASDLKGSMSVDNSGERPEFAVRLASKSLQLDDFSLGEWSPDGKQEVSVDDATETEDVAGVTPGRNQLNRRAGVAPLLSYQSLSRFNASLAIEMTEVLSGADFLGSGSMMVVLRDGRFAIEPLELKLAKGTAHLEFSFFPGDKEAEIHLATQVNRLDVGILAHRVKPDSTMGGILFLDIELDSTAQSLSELMANGKGHFDLGFAPVNLDSSQVDLWAVNLLAALATEVDNEATSVINCLVASFSMEDGMMQERAIFMDTTQMSIEGEANIDFKTRTLKLRLSPKAKRPEFFSLAIPVKVQGSFEEFGVGINKLRLTGSLASFVTSPIHVPLRRLFVNERPKDGVEACWAAWDNRNVEQAAVSGRGD